METDDSNRPTNIRWVVFSLAFAASLLLYLHRYLFGFIKPILATEWGLDAADLGRLESGFFLCYTLFQFPLALAADLAGVHLVLSGLMLVWFAGLGWMALAPSAGAFRWGLMVLGAGQSAVYACLNRIARTWFPTAIRTTLQGAVGIFAGRLGALSSSLVFTAFLLGMLGLDWRSAILILVGLGCFVLLAFAWFFRNSPERHPGVNSAELILIEGTPVTNQGPRGSIGGMLRSLKPRPLLNLLALNLQSLLSTVADSLYSGWIPLFLAQVHRLDFQQMGIFAALPLLGGAFSGVLGGVLNDYWIARTGNRRWARSGVAILGKGSAAGLLFLALVFFDRPYLFCLVLFFVKLFGDWSLTSSWAVVSDIGGRATASVFAFNNSVAGIGLIVAPVLFGSLVAENGWRWLFTTVAIIYFLCALSWLLIDSSISLEPTSERNSA